MTSKVFGMNERSICSAVKFEYKKNTFINISSSKSVDCREYESSALRCLERYCWFSGRSRTFRKFLTAAVFAFAAGGDSSPSAGSYRIDERKSEISKF